MRLLAIFLFAIASTQLQAQKPNVILIVSDDAGFADWGFMDDYLQTLNPGQSATPVPTPALDTLRQRGVLFTNAYTAPVCSPSRAAIVTGSYQNRIGYEYNINNLTDANTADGLAPDTTTIFDHFDRAGYTTGAIGKWHLGARDNAAGLGNRPENQGVDEFLGIWRGSRNYTIGSQTLTRALRETISNPFTDNVLESDGSQAVVWPSRQWDTNLPGTSDPMDTNAYFTTACGIGATDFIERHHADAEPFFLYVAFTSPHGPIGASPHFSDPAIASLSGRRKEYASMILTMDKEINRILKTVDDPVGDGSVSLAENTVILFINDNGGASGIGADNTPLRGFKGSPFEGGVRVPMILAGPGIPVNQSYNAPVHSIDILPTCLATGGITPPADIDGISLLPFVNGTAVGSPHKTINIRQGDRLALRKDNWKLVKNGRGTPFLLFDLASDISETTDLSANNPAKVAELQRDLTDFEVASDKPRHATLGDGANSINHNDRFVLSPKRSTGAAFNADLTLVGGPKLNGDFNAGGAGGVHTFAQTPDWQNIGAGTQNENTSNTNLSLNGTRNGIIAENPARQFGLDTEHILAIGERFQVTYQWRDASNWNDASDRVRITLFTTADDTINGVRTDLQSIDSSTSQANSTYQSEIARFEPVPEAVEGKRLFLSINAAQSGNGFARIDNVVLARGTTIKGDSMPLSVSNWSNASAWIDPDTESLDTLLVTDAFAGCVLDFPTTDAFSYRATNDLKRLSDLPFLANSIRLTGDFGGADPQRAVIDGNALLLSESLNQTPPSLVIGANGDSFSFDLKTDITLYNDLLVTGDGTASVTLTGTLRDAYSPCSITKSGDSEFLLANSPTYTGTTTISKGKLTLASGVQLNTTPLVHVANGGVLGGNGSVSAPITGAGEISPGQSIGTLTCSKDATIGKLTIEIDASTADQFIVGGQLNISTGTLDIRHLEAPTAAYYLVASYASLTGTFRSVSGLPIGYDLSYDFAIGDSKHIALVKSGNPNAYQIWAASHGLTGANADLTADPDNDQLANGFEFLVGSNPNTKDLHLLFEVAKAAEDIDLSIVSDRAARNQLGSRLFVQTSPDLDTWSTVTTLPEIISHPDNPNLEIVTYALSVGDNATYFRLGIE